MEVEYRQHHRLKLTSVPAPARLFTVDDRRELFFRPVDVSRIGLGLLIAEKLPVKSELIIAVSGLEIPLRVTWGTPEPHDRDLFRYGLQALNDAVDFEEVFFAHGCLDEDLGGNPSF